MKVTFHHGPLDGAEFEHDEDLPPVLDFPDHDSWGLLSETMWQAGDEQSFRYRLAEIVPDPGPLPKIARYAYEPVA